MIQVRARLSIWVVLLGLVSPALSRSDPPAPATLPHTPGCESGSEVVSAHPRLLFTASDRASLRAKVTDNPDDFDDADFARIQNWASVLLARPASSIVASGTESYGLYNIPILGMAYQLADDNDPLRSAYQELGKLALGLLAQMYLPSPTDAHNSSLRLFVLALGFDLLFDSSAVPPSDPAYPPDRRLVVGRMLAYLDPSLRTRFDWKCREFPPYTSNGSTLVGAATGLAALVLRGETTAETTLDEALAWAQRVVEADLNSIFDPDGGANEGELYGPFALRFLMPYVEARRRWDGLDLGARPELQHLDRAFAFAVLPNGCTTQANDGNYTELGLAWNDTYANWCQTRHASQAGRWVYAQLAPRWPAYQRDWMASVLWNQGPCSTDLTTVLSDSYLAGRRGYYSYRTGFTAPEPGKPTDTVFTFSAGTFGGGHAHEDQGTFTLFADGCWYLPDYGYSRAPSTACKESEAHNLLFIDDRGQHNAGNLIGTDGLITAAHLGAGADYMQADLRNAFSTHSPLNDPDVPWEGIDWSWGYESVPNTVQKAVRQVLVVKRSAEAGEYFVIADEIDKDGLPHTYDWTLHTGLGNTLATATNPITITPPASTGALLQAYFASPEFPRLSLTSAVYARASADPDTRRLRATICGEVAPAFLVALVPVRPGAAPDCSALTEMTGGIGMRLHWPAGTDEILCRRGAEWVEAGELRSDAAAVWVRRHANGKVRKFLLAEGTALRDGDLELVSITGGRGSVSNDERTISVSDPSLHYMIWAPQASAATAGNQALALTREGDFVYIGPSPVVAIDGDSLQAAPLDPTSMAFFWRTPFAADSRVVYGNSPDCRLASPRDTTLTTDHLVVLRHLCRGKRYYYQVISQGAAAHARSPLRSFTSQEVLPSAKAAGTLGLELEGATALARPSASGRAPATIPDCMSTDTGEDAAATARLSIVPHPNPVRERIGFYLAPHGSALPARAGVFDAAGRLVRDLGDWPHGAPSRLEWDCRTAGGQRVAAGVYFVRLLTGERTASARFTVLQ